MQALLALGLAATLGAPAGATPTVAVGIVSAATPALWEVRDGDTTIFLFGTFHSLDSRTAWFEGSVSDAFDRSAELILETIVPDDPSIARVGAQPGDFLASTRNAAAAGRAAGMSVDHGADAVLKRRATAQGKPVAGLELYADQLSRLQRIAAAPAPAYRPPTTPTATLGGLLTAWKSGDTTAFGDMLAGFEAKAPAAYRILIADRNVRYGEWIERRLDQPGTVFLAVGSGHLAGKDSVQNWLSSQGIFARRIS